MKSPWFRQMDMHSSRILHISLNLTHSMASHLAAATLIVIFKEYMIKGRKIKTGWSHSTQRQLQQAAAATHLQQPHPPPMIPHHRQPSLQMQPPQMTPLPPMAAPGYMFPQ